MVYWLLMCLQILFFLSVLLLDFFLVFILESLSLSCVCSKTFNYSWVLFCCWKSRIRVRNREKNLVSESFFLLSIDFSNETQIIIIIKKKTVERKRALSWKKNRYGSSWISMKKNTEFIPESNVSRFNKV